MVFFTVLTIRTAFGSSRHSCRLDYADGERGRSTAVATLPFFLAFFLIHLHTSACCIRGANGSNQLAALLCECNYG